MPEKIKEVLRTANAKHWKTDVPGVFVAEIYNVPIHYQNDQGVFQDIDLNWEYEPGFGKKTKKSKHHLRIIQDGTLRFGFAKGVYVDYSLPGDMEINSNEALLVDAWEKTDLKYINGPRGVKGEIILKAAGHPASFVFPVALSGCNAIQVGNELAFTSEGQIVGSVPVPFAVDANRNPGNVILEFDGKNITYTPDAEWLESAVYPVIIDPTTIIQPANDTIGKDTYISQLNSTTNYGTAVGLDIGGFASDNDIYRSLLQFDLSSIPANVYITDAYISLYFYARSNTDSHTYGIHKVTSEWNEATVTWATQPTFDDTSLYNVNIGSVSVTKSWYIGALVRDWYTGAAPNYGIIIKSESESTENGIKEAASSANTTYAKPSLTVIYNYKPVATPTDPTGTDAVPEIINTLTPRLTWSYSDADADAQASFQIIIKRASDNAIIKDTGEIASANAYYDVPASTLAGSTKYCWQVKVKDAIGNWGNYSEAQYFYTNATTPPTNLIPNSNTSFDATLNKDLEWTFQDPDVGDSQSAYQVIITRVSDGVTVHDTGKVISPTAKYTLPANTLVNGINYQWKVRTWDSHDLASDYSSLASFRTSSPPVVLINVPVNEGTYDKGILTVTWTYSDSESDVQAKYRAKLLDINDNVLEDSGEVSGAAIQHQFAYILANNTQYKVSVTVWDETGQQSVADINTFISDFIPPVAPVITISPNSGGGYINITIANPDNDPGKPATDRNDVYRRKVGELNWVRIAKEIGPNGSYVDYAVASGVIYEYKVVAISVSETPADSNTGTGSITIAGVWLHDPLDPEVTCYQFKLDRQSRGIRWIPDAELMRYEGRTRPVTEYGETDEYFIDVNLQALKNTLDFELLMALAQRKSMLCYRDGRGKKVFGTIPGGIQVEETSYGYSLTFQFVENAYIEEV